MDELYRTKEQPPEEKPKKMKLAERLPWAPPLMLD